MTTNTFAPTNGQKVSSVRAKSIDGITQKHRVDQPAKPTGHASTVDLQPQLGSVPDKPGSAELDPAFFDSVVPGLSTVIDTSTAPIGVTDSELGSDALLSGDSVNHRVATKSDCPAVSPDSVVPNASSHPKIWELRGFTAADSELAFQAANDSMRRQAADAAATEEPERTTRDHIHECFGFVAMGYACTLAMLLTETRKRNIDDDDVREVISDDETDILHGGCDDRKFRCYGSRAGVLFIERTDGVVSRLASAYELFAELNGKNGLPQNVGPTPPTKFVLSDDLQERGEELTELEAIVLDAAQTLHKRFKHGMEVSFRAVQRIVLRYHFDVVQGASLRSVADGLHNRGLCEISQRTFRLMRHSGPERKPTSPSRFTRLTTHPMQIELLRACGNCCGTGFRNRNVSARAAVQALMVARFNLTKDELNKLVRDSIELGNLEEVPSKGTTALRLTPASEIVLKGKAETLAEAIPTAEMKEEPYSCLTATFLT